MAEFDYQQLADELRFKGIENEEVLAAIASTPRHLFISKEIQSYATEDTSLPIDCQQTISQPYVVARMTEAIFTQKKKPKKVLEIGTGSGYQAAILSKVVDEVYTVERINTLYEQAQEVFKSLSLNNIYTHFDDGNLGWAEHAPYDAILVTAATAEIPEALLEQLAIGGTLILPLGGPSIHTSQILTAITREKEGYFRKVLDTVVFVPLLRGTR
jgi:protein-L-isoaspartate(D-aspartate) O-methyltransferase